MATVIDSLLIELGLDTSKFDANQKKSVEELRKFDEQAQKTSKNTQQGAKNIGDGFEKARNALVSLGVAFVGIKGFTSFAQQTTTTNAGIARTAELFKMSARELDAWGGVLKSVGGDANDFQSSTQAIQQSLSNMQFGDTALLESLGKLQSLGSNALSALDMNTKELDIYKLADAFKQLSDAGKEQDAYVQAQSMGISRNYFMVLKQGGDAVHRLYDENYKLSGINSENTKKAEDLQKAWGKVGQAFSGASNQVMDQMYPALGALAQATQISLEKLVEWDKEMGGGLSDALIFAAGITTLNASFIALKATLIAISGILENGAFALLAKIALPIYLLTHSEGLNKGEDEEIKKIHEEQDKKDNVVRNEKGSIISRNGKPVNGSENITPEITKNFADLEKKYNLPEGMLDKIWSIESSRGSNMVSPKGATGHFQFMPNTATAYGMTEADTYDLNKSSEAAAHMMSDLLKQFKGDEAKAIAAYNWGSGNVTNKGMDRLPDATIKYLKDMSLKVPEQRQEYSQNNSRYMGSNVASGQNQATNNSNSEVNIQNMNIQTQATDSDGIVEGMKISMQNNSLINLGMVGNR